ncbi:hypothetical protein J3Q64DRAFT_1645035, partial [Phycomyces blakesleeanus]
STNRCKIYAIIFGLEKFRPLLLGNPNLDIHTDHSALVYLYSSSYLSSNLQNYVDTLNEYGRLKITYVKGVKNTLSNALSRLYPPIQEDIQQKQKEDKVIKKCSNIHILAVKLNSKQFKNAMLDNMISPLLDRTKMVEDAHRMGHFGIEEVVKSLLSDGVYWTSMYKDCKDVIAKCILCAQHTIVKRGYNPKKSIIA